VFTGPRFGEDGAERRIADRDGRIDRHLTVWLDPVLEAVQLPATVPDLNTGLANVERNNFPHHPNTGIQNKLLIRRFRKRSIVQGRGQKFMR
jgi:hypothetical protein